MIGSGWFRQMCLLPGGVDRCAYYRGGGFDRCAYSRVVSTDVPTTAVVVRQMCLLPRWQMCLLPRCWFRQVCLLPSGVDRCAYYRGGGFDRCAYSRVGRCAYYRVKKESGDVPSGGEVRAVSLEGCLASTAESSSSGGHSSSPVMSDGDSFVDENSFVLRGTN